MVSIMKLSVVLAMIVVVCVPVVVNAAKGGGDGGKGGSGGKGAAGKQPMLEFDQAVLARGLQVMRTGSHVGTNMLRTPQVDDLVYAFYGRNPSASMLAGVEGQRPLVVLPGVIAETRQEGGLEPGAMTIVVRWNNRSPHHLHMNMNAVFPRTERVEGDEPDEVAAVVAAPGAGHVVGEAAGGVVVRTAAERALHRLLETANEALTEAEDELTRVYETLDHTEARFAELDAVNRRLVAELQQSRASIATTAAATVIAIANANAAGTAAGTAAAAAAAAAAVAAADAVVDAVAAAGHPNDPDDPADPVPNVPDPHADPAPTRKRSKPRFFSPPNTMFDKLSDWKDDPGNCGGARL